MIKEMIVAVGLMLVLEGILPLVRPDIVRNVLLNISLMKSWELRAIGLSSILVGLLLIKIFR